MKKLSGVVIGCVVMVSLVGFFQVNTANAYSKFLKAFMTKYVGDKTAQKNDTQKALEGEIKRVKRCAVCHDMRKDENGKASKKNRNPYGEALNKFLTKDDKNDVEKAIKMLEKVEKSKPKDAKESDPTFGALIQKGKLPFEKKRELGNPVGK